MEQLSFSTTSRRNADKNLLTILLAGVGGSLAFHIAAIAGVAHWWKPIAAIDEPMEITMVDTAPGPPPAKPAPKLKPLPIVKAESKPVPIVKVPTKSEPKTIPAKPVPIVKTAASLDNFADRTPTKPVSKPVPKEIAPQPTPVIPPAFPEKLFKSPQPEAKTPVAPKQKVAPQPKQQKIVTEPQPETPIGENQSGLASNSPNRQLAARSTDTPVPSQEQDFGQVAPSKINAPTEDISPNNNNQSGLTGNLANSSKLTGKLVGNNANSPTEDNFGEVAPSKIKTPTTDEFAGSNNNQSGLANKPTGGSKLGTRLAGNTPSSNNASDGEPSGVAPGNSWRSARAEPGAGLKPNPDNSGGDDTGSSGVAGLECINRCEISGLTDLEDRDSGKDKLRIRIAIDPRGNVTRASIAKSSGNSTIDRIVINGVKQMQFRPPGKIVERVVKANILL
jgi:TonB family protein